MSHLGRRTPTDFDHVEKYPYRLIAGQSVGVVEDCLPLPYWHWSHDQGSEGSCVGFGTSMMMSIVNELEARKSGEHPYTHRYAERWLWNRAKQIDEWPQTNPGDDNGTSVRAACDVLRKTGHIRISRNKRKPVSLEEGIVANRWATTVDEIRTAIGNETPISMGVTWYANFDRPVEKGRDYYIGEGKLGRVRGGHCLCLYGASDRRQAFKLKNSWGKDYPLVWIPYDTVELLIKDYGEFALITDR